MTTEPSENEVESFADDLLKNLNDEYVVPELERRTANGDEVAAVFAFMVLFHSPQDQVLINGEVPGDFKVKVARDVLAGEEVGVEDFDPLSDFKPNREIEGSQYIVVLRCKGGWGMKLKFGQSNMDNANRHFERATQFLETARALGKGRIESFVDTAYSSAELFAKAELAPAYPVTAEALGGYKKHWRVANTHGLWSRLDNTDPQFTRLLNELNEARGPARYLDKPNSMSKDEASDIREREPHQKAVSAPNS